MQYSVAVLFHAKSMTRLIRKGGSEALGGECGGRGKRVLLWASADTVTVACLI